MNIHDSLKAICSYPIPDEVIAKVCVNHSLSEDTEVTASVLNSAAYILAEADIFAWLVSAPSVSQGGVSFNITDSNRKQFAQKASARYEAANLAGVDIPYPTFGYKGSRL